MLESLRRRHRGSPLHRLLFYEFILVSARSALWLLFGHRARCGKRMPIDGPVLIVANHQSFLDPAMIAVGSPRQLDFIARRGLFKVPVFGWLISALHSLPIDENGGDAAAMKASLQRLGEGRAVLIFPEGSRSPDGAMHEFKRGAAVLLKRSACPVIPAAVEGPFDAWPRTKKLPRPFGPRVRTRFGYPIDHAELMKDGPDEALRRLECEVAALRDELRQELGKPTGHPMR